MRNNSTLATQRKERTEKRMTNLVEAINKLRAFAGRHRDEHEPQRVKYGKGASCQLCELANEIDKLLHPTREILSITTKQKTLIQIEGEPHEA
jgi:hypothetical protein